MIKIDKLNKFFNKGKPNEIHVINDISLELPDSGMVAVFGKSGCGKTTLLNVIGGLDGYGSGSVSIEGNDIKRDTDVTRNKYIGYIFQNYNLNKEESCYDNVADALRLCGMSDGDEMKKRVMAALRNVGLENYHGRTPDTLSGGQQQRVAIARAIVKNPRIILADEPTGNLDEANTVMVMDLLKEIAKDHLVILVTHEANLVDYYCDTVIELMDGRVVDVRRNENANGFTSKGKNDIYLGELERTEIADGRASIEYYGDSLDAPVSLTVVNSGGKLYIRINTPKVQVLDESSEVKLHKGVYEQKAEEERKAKDVDMSELPPINGSRFGRLFGFKSALKGGYVSNFKRGKLGKKILRVCMCLFAAVVVLMSAVFGTAFSDLRDARNAYNHNVFYVYTGDGDVSDKLNAAVGDSDTGIDYVRLSYGVPNGDMRIKFLTGYFESFTSSAYDDSYTTNAVLLSVSLSDGCEVIAGKRDGLSGDEIVITTRVADALLENSSLGYVSSYDDLLGLITPTLRVDGKNLRVAGVVESEESAVYLSELAMAMYVMNNSDANPHLAYEYDIDVAEGETVLITRFGDSDTVEIPNVGDTVKIHGHELKVARVIKYIDNYEEWLKDKGISVTQNENESTVEYNVRLYSKLDEYLSERYFFEGDNIDMWLYAKKGVEEVKYYYTSRDYYNAIKYYEQYGVYPEDEDIYDLSEKYPDPHDTVENARRMYEQEYYNGEGRVSVENSYLVHENDYISMSKRNGETHESVLLGGKYGSVEHAKEMYVVGTTDVVYSPSSQMAGSGGATYTVVHSNDPSLTAEYLEREFSDIVTGEEHMPSMLFPDEIFNTKIAASRNEILTSLIAMAVIFAVMSLCMYFIMRSSLMNRIKEVGIYRAIGVSKKNLVFRFFIEAILLTTLTVLVGYILTSAFLGAALSITPMMESLLYYPMWLAGAVLAILYALCLFFGTLPIRSLLRRTPSEILSKYDI